MEKVLVHEMDDPLIVLVPAPLPPSGVFPFQERSCLNNLWLLP